MMSHGVPNAVGPAGPPREPSPIWSGQGRAMQELYAACVGVCGWVCASVRKFVPIRPEDCESRRISLNVPMVLHWPAVPSNYRPVLLSTTRSFALQYVADQVSGPATGYIHGCHLSPRVCAERRETTHVFKCRRIRKLGW